MNIPTICTVHGNRIGSVPITYKSQMEEFNVEITVIPKIILLVCTMFVGRTIVWLLCCQTALTITLLKKLTGIQERIRGKS